MASFGRLFENVLSLEVDKMVVFSRIEGGNMLDLGSCMSGNGAEAGVSGGEGDDDGCDGDGGGCGD